MKTLVCQQPRHFEYNDVPTPELPKDHALIRIRRIGICGTDLHAFEGTQPYFTYPRILGHELSGEIVDVNGDNVQGLMQNEMVAVMPYISCGQCISCRIGKTNCCVHMQVTGVHCDGGMAEYFCVPNALVVKGRGLSPDPLALVEPFAIGMHAVHRAAISTGEFVLVMGAGPIGIGVMLFAKLAGAEVIAVDVNNERLQIAKKVVGLKYIINANNTKDILQNLKEITHSDLPTLLVDATGNQRVINNSLQYVAHGGRYLLVGLQKGDLVFSHPEFHKKEMTLMSSRNATRGDFDKVMDHMVNGDIDLSAYITHRVHFDRLKEAFPGFIDPANGVLKAIVEL